jgi:hypothetical protein
MKKRMVVAVAVGVAVGFSALVLLLSSKPAAPPAPPGPATLSGWIPPSLDPKPAGTGSWTFQYPTLARDLAVPPVNQPHILLNLGRPMPIHALKVAAEPPGTFKIWATVLDDKGKEEIVLLGEGAGPGMEMVIPWKSARRPVAALRFSYSAGAATYVEAATVDTAAIQPEHGKAYTAPVPAGLGPPDDGANPTRSKLGLLEDTTPLGPAHTLHEEIRKLAGGRYSHWGDMILFSSSDGTDPRKNGRKYKLMAPKKHEIRLTIS